MQNPFLLTFDLEEFDLPHEFGVDIDKKKVFSTSYDGCKAVLKILDAHDIKSTFFVTTIFAKRYPAFVKKLVKGGHEIALHGYLHSNDIPLNNRRESLDYLKKAKRELRQVTRTKIVGFRHPKLKRPPFDMLRKLGFQYDSSIHPTYIPGRYNNFLHNTNYHNVDGVTEVPISVTPLSRTPFSWLWFRNFGVNYAKFCTLLASRSNSFINLYFHPWEFIDLDEYDIPFPIKRNTGERMEHMMREYVDWCANNNFRFYTIKDFLNSI